MTLRWRNKRLTVGIVFVRASRRLMRCGGGAWLQEVVQRWLNRELVVREVKQRRQWTPVGQSRARLTQLVEETVSARLEGGETRARRVF